VFREPKFQDAYFTLHCSIKAHDSAINWITLIRANLPDPKKGENRTLNLIASAGQDHFIHLWTEKGLKIGTFGAEQTWNLRNVNFKPNKNDDEKINIFDINYLENENRIKLSDINEKLK